MACEAAKRGETPLPDADSPSLSRRDSAAKPRVTRQRYPGKAPAQTYPERVLHSLEFPIRLRPVKIRMRTQNKRPLPKKGPAQQEVLSDAPQTAFATFTSRSAAMMLSSTESAMFTGLRRPIDSRYVYEVSCRVRAKSYPRKHFCPHSPHVNGSPVHRQADDSTIGFTARNKDYHKLSKVPMSSLVL